MRDLTKLSKVFGQLAATNKQAAEKDTHMAPSLSASVQKPANYLEQPPSHAVREPMRLLL